MTRHLCNIGFGLRFAVVAVIRLIVATKDFRFNVADVIQGSLILLGLELSRRVLVAVAEKLFGRTCKRYLEKVRAASRKLQGQKIFAVARRNNIEMQSATIDRSEFVGLQTSIALVAE